MTLRVRKRHEFGQLLINIAPDTQQSGLFILRVDGRTNATTGFIFRHGIQQPLICCRHLTEPEKGRVGGILSHFRDVWLNVTREEG